MAKIKRPVSAILSLLMAAGMLTAAPVSAADASNAGASASLTESVTSFSEETTVEETTEAAAEAEAVTEKVTEVQKPQNVKEEEEAVGASKINISNCSISFTSGSDTFIYTGEEIKPNEVIVEYKTKTLVEGKDYTLTYANNINPGTATFTVTGKGSYTGSTTTDFTISKRNLSTCTVALKNNSFIYDGKAHKAGVTVKYNGVALTSGTDYSLSYSNYTAKGTAKVTVTGKGNFTGKVTKSYIIGEAKDFTDCSFNLSSTSCTYNGAARKPTATVTDGSKKLTSGVDYSVAYANNTNVGTATVTLTGKGIYQGTKKLTFKINAKKLTDSAVKLKSTELQYDGKNEMPVTVKDGTKTLVNGTDYTLSYTKNKTVDSTANVTVTFKGNYSGKVTKNYEVIKRNIFACKITYNTKTSTYGKENVIKPTIKNGSITLREGVDYFIEYEIFEDNPYIQIIGMGNYTDSEVCGIVLKTGDINDAEISVSKGSNCLYDDGVVRSLVIVKSCGRTLIRNKDYKIEFDDDCGGIVSATITGMGHFKGTTYYSYLEPTDYQYNKTRFVWGKDNWTFTNSSEFFTKGYAVGDSVKEAMAKDFKMTEYDKDRVFSNIDYKTNYETFRGSCYGVSVSSILAKQRLLKLENYTNSSVTSKVLSDKNGTDVCNFVQAMYSYSDFSELTREVTKCCWDLSWIENGQFTQKNYIDKLNQELKNNDKALTLIFRIEYPSGQSCHAVVAYGVESANYTYHFLDGTKKTYDRRILIYDPNHGDINTIYDDSCVYFNSQDGSWIIPCWTDKYNGTSKCYWNAETGRKVDTGSINSIIKYHSITRNEDVMTGRFFDYSINYKPDESNVGTNENNNEAAEIKWASYEDSPKYKNLASLKDKE
ncbi:MAG: hypothetical protein IIZ36_03070, partial [Ruminococcus sp.]|nr:hypothetical protein [Ruminococcus sp.]